MPSIFKIPEKYKVGLSRIRTLNDDTIGTIRSVLDKIPPTTKPAEVTAAAAASADHLKPVENLREILDALLSLYNLRSSGDMSIDDVADGVGRAMEKLEDDELRVPSSEVDSYTNKLKTLLGAEVFTVLSKALDLATDDERTFCDARIITDLRAIFGNNVEDGPKGMVIVHLLKLAFHQSSNRHQEFYVSLDSDDLQTLKRAIERAEEKSAVLKSKFQDIRFFLS